MEERQIVRMNLLEVQYEYFAKRGLLFLEEEIDECSTFAMNLFYRHSLLPKEEAIWLILNSPGGLVHNGLSIYDAIKSVVAEGRTVNIAGHGLVASMATVILQAGTRRYSFPNTQFLIHQVSETIMYKREEVSEGEERIEESKRINDIVMNIIAERSGVPVEELKARCKKTDYWLDVNMSKKLGDNGLIDEVITRLPILAGKPPITCEAR